MAEKRKIPVRARLDDDGDDDDLVGPRTGAGKGGRPSAPRGGAPEGPRLPGGPKPRPAPAAARAPAKRPGLDRGSVMALVREIPSFGKLLWGLAKDPRVSKVDKALVLAALTYTIIPADIIPDWIPGLGEIEDVFLLGLALSRLLNNAGEDVLLDHWEGDDETLETVLDLLDGLTDFLPRPIQRLLGVGA
jgi:uncharacterized membrane protein YkvA (DUF1232 family)